MNTTIMISSKLKSELNSMKLRSNETYEDIIKDLIDDRKFLTKAVMKDISEAEAEVKAGKTVSFDVIKKRLGINV